METKTTGILLQGRISDWTKSIIKEYQKNFPESEIVLQTFSEDISNIPCKVVQSIPPEPTYPIQSTKNFQVRGSQDGLKEMNSEIILKCRSDLFVHNPNIFNIFFNENQDSKIMYAEFNLKKEQREYWIADFCQLSSKKTLLEFWNDMPFDDGKEEVAVEIWLTKNYLLNTKKDHREWEIAKKDYFLPKRYHEDFQIEFEKFVKFKYYQDDLLYHSSL